MIDPADKSVLLDIARHSIEHGLQYARPLIPDVHNYSEKLQEITASFVTLKIHGQLRGCIGSLEARQPLVMDVAENAYAAAFRDPRFPPVSESEFTQLEYHISLLTPAEPLQFRDEADLISQLQPNVDGLVLEDGRHRGTFLPSVWESLPDRKQFLQQLKLKAGLSPDYWSDTVKVSRYTVEDVE
ncbi:MAG: AmmeMemoRadiSam system protein A [Thiohalophilus sp.]